MSIRDPMLTRLASRSAASSFGLASERTRPTVMTVAHRHDDIELNYAPSPIDYLIDGVRTTIPAYTVVAFWAARPHQLLAETAPEWLHWLTVPLRDVLAFRLPGSVTSALLRGVLVELPDTSGVSINDALVRWAGDLETGIAESRTIVELEVHAFLRRAAPVAHPIVDAGLDSRPTDSAGATAMSHAALMAEFIAENATSAITVTDVAAAVHLHPNHAMTVFRRSIGVTIGDYLALSRVAHAQRLLITTDQPVTAIGHEAGFRSTSQFYDRFGRACGMSPAAYRQLHGSRSRPTTS